LNTNIFESAFEYNNSDNDISNIFVKNIFDDENASNLVCSEDISTDTIKYIPLSEFMYADTRMYILTGGLPRVETKIKPIPTAIFSAALIGIFYLQHDLQMKTI
jgi:hypothetical protein